jgi:hypothetical protein
MQGFFWYLFCSWIPSYVEQFLSYGGFSINTHWTDLYWTSVHITFLLQCTFIKDIAMFQNFKNFKFIYFRLWRNLTSFLWFYLAQEEVRICCSIILFWPHSPVHFWKISFSYFYVTEKIFPWLFSWCGGDRQWSVFS